MSATWEIREGDALERLAEMPDESVQCCVTSPPYFGLRDYGVDGQIGLESTPDEFVAALVAVFREVRRVLRSDGTLWLNIGDSYAAARSYQVADSKHQAHDFGKSNATVVPPGCKAKDLIGIPWLLAFALRADGWYLRSDIIWAKPNPMPESVTDRPTSAHEHVFLLAKSARYFYDADAIREAWADERNGASGAVTLPYSDGSGRNDTLGGTDRRGLGIAPLVAGRNKRNVWEIATQPYGEAHFATFPPKLVEPCILAGTSPQACGECGAPWERVVERESAPRDVFTSRHAPDDGLVGSGRARVDGELLGKGAKLQAWRDAHPPRTVGWCSSCEHGDDTGRSVVLDPFSGAGTTGLVALRHGRSFLGIELNPIYAEMARERIRRDAPLLNTPAEVVAA